MIHGSKKVFEIRIDDPLVSGLHFTPDLGQGIGCLATLTILINVLRKGITGGWTRQIAVATHEATLLTLRQYSHSGWLAAKVHHGTGHLLQL